MYQKNFCRVLINKQTQKTTMNINTQNNISFNGKCPELRAGRDVCRLVKSQFPSYSVSLLNKRIDKMHEKGYLTGEKYDKTVKWLKRRIEGRNEILNKALYHGDYKLYFDLMKFIKMTKIADCGHLADLSSFILRLNGYDTALADLYTSFGGKIDHAVCVFNKDNTPVKAITRKTIILDAWLGECDLAPNFLKKYKQMYDGYFKEHGLVGPEEKFIYLKPEERYFAIKYPYKMNISDKEISKLRDKFPNLLIKDSKYEEKKESKIHSILNYFRRKAV